MNARLLTALAAATSLAACDQVNQAYQESKQQADRVAAAQQKPIHEYNACDQFPVMEIVSRTDPSKVIIIAEYINSRAVAVLPRSAAPRTAFANKASYDLSIGPNVTAAVCEFQPHEYDGLCVSVLSIPSATLSCTPN